MSASPSLTSPFYSPYGRLKRLPYLAWMVSLFFLIVFLFSWKTGGAVAMCTFLASVALMVVQTIKRSRDAGWHWFGTILVLAVLNGVGLMALMVWPSAKPSEQSAGETTTLGPQMRP